MENRFTQSVMIVYASYAGYHIVECIPYIILLLCFYVIVRCFGRC